MSNFPQIIKDSSEIAMPRAYLIACCCDIEKLSQEIIYILVNSNRCSYLYQFIKRKEFEGQLNFKWKAHCFKKFIGLFGSDFSNNVMDKIKVEIDENSLENSFETIRSNRGIVAHENSDISLTISEIEDNYNNCMKALNITKTYVNSLN